MRKKQEKLLNNLIKIPSPSGYEGALAHFIRKTLLEVMPRTKVTIDSHNNVVAVIEGRTKKKIMIDAHLDQLGFIVHNVDKDGYVALNTIGGYDLSILRGRKVWVLPENKHKPFEAVISTKHAHLIEYGEEKEELPSKSTDLTLDIGIRRRKQVFRYLEIGDPIVFKSEFTHMLEDYYSGAGFDDKTGVYVLLETIKALRRTRKKPQATLVFTFSSQEEIGCKGAKEVARRYKPDLFVGLDVTCSTDSYEIEERDAGRCDLGQGMTVVKGINVHRPSLKLLQSVARANKIKLQYQACNGEDSTNAEVVANELDGIKMLNLAIPCRHLHSPVEIINFKDLDSGVKLFTHFLLSRKLGRTLEK